MKTTTLNDYLTILNVFSCSRRTSLAKAELSSSVFWRQRWPVWPVSSWIWWLCWGCQTSSHLWTADLWKGMVEMGMLRPRQCLSFKRFRNNRIEFNSPADWDKKEIQHIRLSFEFQRTCVQWLSDSTSTGLRRRAAPVVKSRFRQLQGSW